MTSLIFDDEEGLKVTLTASEDCSGIMANYNDGTKEQLKIKKASEHKIKKLVNKNGDELEVKVSDGNIVALKSKDTLFLASDVKKNYDMKFECEI